MKQTVTAGKLIFCLLIGLAFLLAVEGFYVFTVILAVTAWAIAFAIDKTGTNR